MAKITHPYSVIPMRADGPAGTLVWIPFQDGSTRCATMDEAITAAYNYLNNDMGFAAIEFSLTRFKTKPGTRKTLTRDDINRGRAAAILEASL
jgi:hypothetical protein